jgi:hypothetical protein
MEKSGKKHIKASESEEMARFWQENEPLFELLAKRLGDVALTQDMKRFGWYVTYLEKIIALGFSLARQAQKEEEASGHA